MSKVRGNIKNAGEVFLITDDAKETKDIYDLNDTTSRHNIKEMLSLAKDKEDLSMNWNELTFVQKDLRQKAQQLQDQQVSKR
jgi:guanylate kinase